MSRYLRKTTSIFFLVLIASNGAFDLGAQVALCCRPGETADSCHHCTPEPAGLMPLAADPHWCCKPEPAPRAESEIAIAPACTCSAGHGDSAHFLTSLSYRFLMPDSVRAGIDSRAILLPIHGPQSRSQWIAGPEPPPPWHLS